VFDQAHHSDYRYYISLWLPAAVLGTLLIAVLLIQMILSWKAHDNLTPVNRHLAQISRLQSINLELQRELLESLSSGGIFTRAERERLRSEIEATLNMQAHLSQETPQALARARAALADINVVPREALFLTLSGLRNVLEQEVLAHKRLIEEISRSTAMELEIGAITLLVFPGGAILLIYLMRRRILAPLNHLGFLMTLLGRKNYAPAPVAGIDPILRPLTENYNTMVTRLAQLEREHASRERDLQSQVESAARVLLEQQRTLANTERLAAVGETLARIAHELRNPLAGVKLACAHLREELGRQDVAREYIERFDVVAVEVDRIIALLNSLLDQSRHTPEVARETNVATAVTDVVALARYQIPAQIRIAQRIDGNIVCWLPDALFRQALLNLLLNAREALGNPGGSVSIEAGVLEGTLHVSVCDDGPGFSDDLLASGIRAFMTHREGGTGLGLSMVQRFARSLGGHVRLSNVKPHGACVTIDLPCEKEQNV
jgi:two-component system NtrC family sensor kinase